MDPAATDATRAGGPGRPGWLREIKFDGYRMHARLDRGAGRLLPRTGLDWTHKYPPFAAAVSFPDARQAYLDGEFYGVYPDGITSFGMIQAAPDAGNAAGLVYFSRRPSVNDRILADHAVSVPSGVQTGLSPASIRGLIYPPSPNFPPSSCRFHARPSAAARFRIDLPFCGARTR
jgi:hypothetical protein